MPKFTVLLFHHLQSRIIHLQKNATITEKILSACGKSRLWGEHAKHRRRGWAEWFTGRLVLDSHRSGGVRRRIAAACYRLLLFANPKLLAPFYGGQPEGDGSGIGELVYCSVVYGGPLKPSSAPGSHL